MRTRKLTHYFLGYVISITVLMLVLVVAGYEWIEYGNARHLLVQKLDRMVASQSLILAGPVFEKDRKQIKLILASTISNAEVQRVVVRDQFGAVLDKYGEVASTNPDFVKSTKINFISGNGYVRVGSLEIELTDRVIHQQFKDRLKSDAIMCLVLLISFVACAHFAHYRLIGKPLGRLMDAIRIQKEDGPRPQVEWGDSDEIGVLISQFNEMQIQQQSYETNLQLLVDERTQKLNDAMHQAETANLAKSEFLASMSHELRTPLTSSLGSLGLLDTFLPDDIPDDAKELIEIAKRNNEALLRLVNELLDYEKILSGRLEIETSPQKICELVQSTVNDNQGLARTQSIQFVMTHCDSPVIAQVNEYRFEQVLNNLLSNAAKFSTAGSNVEISVEKGDQTVFIRVKDFGAGIPEEFKSKIYEQFTQADSSATRQFGGTGLGLSISKALVEGMGGEINFVSQVGVGTEFTVTLPIRD